jgi:hypothetical protein
LRVAVGFEADLKICGRHWPRIPEGLIEGSFLSRDGHYWHFDKGVSAARARQSALGAHGLVVGEARSE